MEKFITLLLGGQDIPTYAAWFFFAFIGALLSLYVKSLKRDPSSKNTPAKFSLKFFFQDNLLRLISGFLFAFISFRFSNEFLGEEVTMWGSLLIGASTDRLAGLFENLQSLARK